MKSILIIKHGALGDVVRTSYFAKSIKEEAKSEVELYWFTSLASEPLLRFNPYIDYLITNKNQIKDVFFSQVFSLDDEFEILETLKCFNFSKLTGAFLKDGIRTYTEDSSEWFDMGLISKFGKQQADRLKKENQLSHTDIFKKIFSVKYVKPSFFGNPSYSDIAKNRYPRGTTYIGINAFAGSRWPSKSLNNNVYVELINKLIDFLKNNSIEARILLFGAGEDYYKNKEIASKFDKFAIECVKTDSNVLSLASIIANCNLLISSDSLALHLAIGQGVPTVSFYTSTSMIEIDVFGIGSKIKSLSEDYCSYKPDACNLTITSERLIAASTPFLVNIRNDNSKKSV